MACYNPSGRLLDGIATSYDPQPGNAHSQTRTLLPTVASLLVLGCLFVGGTHLGSHAAQGLWTTTPTVARGLPSNSLSVRMKQPQTAPGTSTAFNPPHHYAPANMPSTSTTTSTTTTSQPPATTVPFTAGRLSTLLQPAALVAVAVGCLVLFWRRLFGAPQVAMFPVVGSKQAGDEETAVVGPSPPPSAPVVGRRTALRALTLIPATTLRSNLPAWAEGLPPMDRSGLTGNFTIPEIGIGCWAWGDAFFWGYDAKNDAQLQESFNYLVDNGVTFFDTAEVYGFGRSEQLVGEFSRAKGQDVQVATKFAALPWRVQASDVVKACEASLKRLGKSKIELYQIHFPNAWANEAYWDGLAQCYERGMVEAVGVSNYGSDALRAIHAKLAARGIPLASNQIQYSLLYPYANENGLKETCDELGVKILAYSPLGLGLLTGKYTPTNLPKGPRAELAKKYLQDATYLQLLETMRDVAEAHGIARDDVAGPVQVSLNWCRAKGTVPIPGVRSLRQAESNIGCLKWDMTPAEVEALDVASKGLPLPAAIPFAKEDVFTHLKMFDS